MTATRAWSSNTAFLFAAVGAAVGLGNIWRFPYISGVNGGGAFILLYLFFVVVLCIPMVMAELFIGRTGQLSTVFSVRKLSKARNLNPSWQIIGWFCIAISALVFSFYSVVAGWSLDYFVQCLGGDICSGSRTSGDSFDKLLDSPGRLIFWHSVIMVATVLIVARGVRGGVERAIKVLLPGLLVILLLLVVVAAFAAEFSQALHFLFFPDFSKLTPEVMLMALGQAFFSVAVGGGAMMTYGAYLSKEVSLVKMATIICLADTAVALLAGLAIFPFVFEFALDASEGPGLIFVTLPVAFGQLPAGQLVGGLFFFLLALAALTTTIALLEPIVSWLEDYRKVKRATIAIFVGLCIWLAGVGEALSFNVGHNFTPFGFIPLLAGKNVFELTDFLVSTLLLPLNNLLIAVFVAWFYLQRADLMTLGFNSTYGANLWRTIARYPLPIAITAIFLYGWF